MKGLYGKQHGLLFILLMTVQQEVSFAYLEEPIESHPPGFHVGAIQHEVATNQIVIQFTLSASMETIPVMYISKPDWSSQYVQSDNVQTHPCESGALANNNICCVNALLEQYQVGPSLMDMYNNQDICPYNNATAEWGKNYTQMSNENAQLRTHTMASSVGSLDFLSSGIDQVPYNETVGFRESIWQNNVVNCTDNNNTMNSTVDCFENTTSNVTRLQQITKYLDTLTYPDSVSYKLLNVENTMFTVELRLNHEYLKSRSRKTVIDSSDSGVAKYEFYIGVTFITLLPYTSEVSISTAQVSFEYFKSDFVFLSISTEQRQTPVDQLDIVIHQGKSVNDDKKYQYVEFDFSYDTALYPGAATIKPNSLRWVKNPTIADVNDTEWNYPCIPSTGYYYTGDQLALDTMAEQTCLPQQPRFCRFDADKNFFFPFPTGSATDQKGFLSGPDPVDNLYIQFILELTDYSGFKHISTVFFGVDLISWPVLEHCEDTDFDYKDVSDALKITATVGIKSANASNTSSSVVLKQTISAIDEVATDAANRNINEIALNTAPPSRRLLSSPGEYGDWSSSEYKDWIDFKIPDIANYTEFAISDSTNRRLLQTEGGVQTCVNPVCGFSKGVDTTSECTQYGTYECEQCKDSRSVIDPYTYNSTRLHCSYGVCVFTFPDGKMKSWGMNWRMQQRGMYKSSEYFRYGTNSLTGFVGDGYAYHNWQIYNEVAKMGFADFGKDAAGIQLTPKAWSAMGPYSSVVVFTDNSIRTWFNFFHSVLWMEPYTSAGGPTTIVSRFPLEAGESIVELSTGWSHFLVRTDKNRVFWSSELLTPLDSACRIDRIPLEDNGICEWRDLELTLPLDLGTTKKVIQIASVVDAFYIIFSDGSVKAINTIHGYAEFQTDTNDFSGYTFATVKDAPFIDFGQGVKRIKSYASKGMGVGTDWSGGRGLVLANGFLPTWNNNDLKYTNKKGPVHTCAIMADDSLKCWGSNWAGQLGYEDYKNRGYKYPIDYNFPTAEETVKDIPAVNVGTGLKVIDMCVGTASTCVVLDNYKVKCWGTNEAGNLGQGDRTRRGHTAGTMGDNLPFIDFGTNVSIVQVECYDSSVCAVTMDGAIRCWGRNCGGNKGTLGTGSVLPYSVPSRLSYKTHEASLCLDFTEPGGDVNMDCADKSGQVTGDRQTHLCRGVGLGLAPREAPPKCGSSVTKSVTARIQMPISVEQFTPILQNQLISAVATVANVRLSQVTIVSITAIAGRRRLLAESVDVKTKVEAEEGSSLSSDQSEFSTADLNTYIASSPTVQLPVLTVGPMEVETAVVEGKVFDFKGASSYAEAAISLEFDAIPFMAYPYSASYTYRIDNLVILNFLGLSNTQYGRIRNMISAGTGFTVEKQSTQKHFTLTPSFGGDILCPEVGDTAGLTTGHMQCFWRRAIVANVVQPVATESLYFYRKENASDAVNAKAWIRDTILGGDSQYGTAAASAHFEKTCSRSNDPLSEARSYGCLFVDPGYRWISRLRDQPTLSPFTISDKTIVVAILTISDAAGVVVRRRLLLADDTGTKEVDLPETETGKENSRQLLQANAAENVLNTAGNAAENVLNTVGNGVIQVNNINVNAELNLLYLSGHKNHHAQFLHIETVCHNDVSVQTFAGNTNKFMLAMGSGGHLGPLVLGLHPVGFEKTPAPASGNRRLLQDGTPGSIMNVSAIVSTRTSFGDVYVNMLACGMETIANKTDLINDQDVRQIISVCLNDVVLSGARSDVLMTLSTCTVDMTIMDTSGCNMLRGLLVLLPDQPEVEWGSADTKTAALYFQIDFDAPYGIFRDDTTLSAHVRATVAETLQAAPDRVHVVFYARESSVTQARRLLQTTDDKATADVWIYKDTRAIYKDVGFNKIPTDDVVSWFRKSSGWREQIESLLKVIPVMQVKSISDGVTTGIKEPRENASASGMDPGYIVAIVFVCLLVLVVVFLGVSLCMKMRKAKSQETPDEEGTGLLKAAVETPNGVGDNGDPRMALFANAKIRVKK
jgi:hypothetical protein